MVQDPNQEVISILDLHINGQPIQPFSRAVGINRITINSWRLGATPDMGVLLFHFFKGTEAGKRLAFGLISVLDPALVGKLAAIG